MQIWAWGNQDCTPIGNQHFEEEQFKIFTTKIEHDLFLKQRFPVHTTSKEQYPLEPQLQLDKSVDNLWTHILLFPQDYTELCCPTLSPGFTSYDNTQWASAIAALDVFDFLTSFTQHTSVHWQTQFIGSKNIPSIYLGCKFSYTQNPSHPNHGQPAATNWTPNSNRVPSHNDAANTRPSTLQTSPILY